MPSIYTPRDLQIEKRHLKFGREIKPTRWWHSGDPGRTAFFNALSSTFPVGEKFFMAAVRHYRDGTPEPLRSQIDDFLYQESMHSREHAAFNRQAQDVGYWPQLDGQRRWLNSAIMDVDRPNQVISAPSSNADRRLEHRSSTRHDGAGDARFRCPTCNRELAFVATR